MINSFAIGATAIAAGQTALDLIGQNLANASTPGYHRQAVNLVNQTTGGLIGTGVSVASITRYDTPSVRAAILVANADQAKTSTQLDISQQVEANLGSGTGGIGDGFENLFNQFVQLTSRPDDAAAKRPVVTAVSDLAQRFNATASEIDRLRNSLNSQISQTVTQINGLATQIADLNVKIANAINAGGQPNDLVDQRDQLINQLSQQIDVRVIDQPNGQVNVISAGAAVVVGQFTNQFQATTLPSGNIAITQKGDVTNTPVNFSGGTLAGQLQEYNQDLPNTRSRLDGLAADLIQKLNEIQATGLGAAGSFTSFTGSIGVPDPTQPLATQNLPFPITAGQLTFSVTDTTTGNRSNTTIAIDPATQSLQDIATALSGIPGLTASVGAGNVLQINAQSGFQFDFAGRDTNPPSNSAVADSDTSGILAGLGINGLYTGVDAASIRLRPDIAANPDLLATSRTGQVGDSTNLERFAAVHDQAAFSGRTLSGEFSDLAASVGSNVSSLTDQQTAKANVIQNLNAQEQAVTGVDTNAELVNLLSFQQMVEGAAKYMAAVNTALDSILNIVH